MIRGVLIVALVLTYTYSGGGVLGSRYQPPPPPLSIVSVERNVPASVTVTIRNNQTYPIRGELEGVETPLLQPGEEYSMRLEPRPVIRVREAIAYVDDVHFDRSRVTTEDVWRAEAQ